jgi:hypothetical protein
MSWIKGLRVGLLSVLACGGLVGCDHAHYVVRHADSGVIAIAEDTPELRAQAEKLMHEHLPAGYVIDDVRVVPLGAPYHTVTQVGPFAEVETHQRHEVMLYYHAPRPVVVPARFNPPPGVDGARSVVPASAASEPANGLPPQPIPVGN